MESDDYMEFSWKGPFFTERAINMIYSGPYLKLIISNANPSHRHLCNSANACLKISRDNVLLLSCVTKWKTWFCCLGDSFGAIINKYHRLMFIMLIIIWCSSCSLLLTWQDTYALKLDFFLVLVAVKHEASQDHANCGWVWLQTCVCAVTVVSTQKEALGHAWLAPMGALLITTAATLACSNHGRCQPLKVYFNACCWCFGR